MQYEIANKLQKHRDSEWEMRRISETKKQIMPLIVAITFCFILHLEQLYCQCSTELVLIRKHGFKTR